MLEIVTAIECQFTGQREIVLASRTISPTAFPVEAAHRIPRHNAQHDAIGQFLGRRRWIGSCNMREVYGTGVWRVNLDLLWAFAMITTGVLTLVV